MQPARLGFSINVATPAELAPSPASLIRLGDGQWG